MRHVFYLMQKLVAAVAPTLPQLPNSQDGRPQPSKQTGAATNRSFNDSSASNTLPQLKQIEGLTRQPSYATPRASRESNINDKSKSRTDEHGNPLPITPAG